jgi:hypothetical protein
VVDPAIQIPAVEQHLVEVHRLRSQHLRADSSIHAYSSNKEAAE